MSQPNSCAYKIIGFASSAITSNAFPFAVTIQTSSRDVSTLTSFVLENWQSFPDQFPENAHEAVQHFTDVLRDYSVGEDSERFFKHLGNLSSGNIRFLKGEDGCEADLLQSQISIYFEQHHRQWIWPESFRRV